VGPRLAELKKVASEWIHSIQFTDPKGSLQDASTLLDEIASRFVVQPATAAYPYRSRATARDLTARSVRLALEARLGAHHSSGLVKKGYPLHGLRSAHHFDVAAANGQPLFAAQTISLDQADQRHVERDVNSAGWALQDVKQLNAAFPTAIVTLFPSGAILAADQQENLERVRAVSDELSVRLVQEQQIDEWAREMATAIPFN
jgi:hypothetical protein